MRLGRYRSSFAVARDRPPKIIRAEIFHAGSGDFGGGEGKHMVARHRGQRAATPSSPSSSSSPSSPSLDPAEATTSARLPRRPSPPPHVAKLVQAFLHGDRRRALRLLTALYDEGMTVTDLERDVLTPAMVKLGEMWMRGRLGESSFKRLGGIAEQVERDFRQYILTARREEPQGSAPGEPA